MTLLQSIYHICPPTWLVSVQGDDFEFGEELTREAEKRAQRVVSEINEFVLSKNMILINQGICLNKKEMVPKFIFSTKDSEYFYYYSISVTGTGRGLVRLPPRNATVPQIKPMNTGWIRGLPKSCHSTTDPKLATRLATNPVEVPCSQ